MAFPALTLQMGHDLRDKLHNCWSRPEEFYILFYGNTMKQNRLLSILQPLHFAENSKDLTETQYERLWKIRTVLETLTSQII
jgi:hypothetical protein